MREAVWHAINFLTHCAISLRRLLLLLEITLPPPSVVQPLARCNTRNAVSLLSPSRATSLTSYAEYTVVFFDFNRSIYRSMYERRVKNWPLFLSICLYADEPARINAFTTTDSYRILAKTENKEGKER